MSDYLVPTGCRYCGILNGYGHDPRCTTHPIQPGTLGHVEYMQEMAEWFTCGCQECLRAEEELDNE